jgi:predicted AlkP superfamily phosphohydrolase/phosphomutase
VRKALVIGLDGASWDFIDPLLQAGELPNLARLIAGGVRATLRSTIPPITAAAWPSFLTGKNPGKHGIFGFKALDLARYGEDGELSSSRPIAGQTLFDHLGALGLPVCAYLVPMTYPVWPINGSMVAGYPTPDVTRVYAHPPELAEWVPAPLESDFDRRNAGPEEVVRLSFDMLERLTRTMERFLAEDRHHFYMVVENLTDFFVHRFWKLRDPTFPTYDRALAAQVGDVIAECYRRVDAAIGRLLAKTPEDWVLVVLSDHGNGRGATRFFHVNQWLERQGLLQPARVGRASLARRGMGVVRALLRSPALKGLVLRLLPKRLQQRLTRVRDLANQVDWAATRAFGVQLYPLVGGITVNLRGRQPDGIVAPGAEYERLCSELLERLRELRDPQTGAQIVREAYRREEVYQGPYLASAPDVVFLTNPDYRIGNRLDQLVTEVDRASLWRWSGYHRMEGVLLLHAPGVFRRAATLDGPEIVDVLPTLYHAMGLPVPTDVDGRVLEGAFEPAFLAERPIRFGGTLGGDGAGGDGRYSEQEEEGIKVALRGFGYIE